MSPLRIMMSSNVTSRLVLVKEEVEHYVNPRPLAKRPIELRRGYDSDGPFENATVPKPVEYNHCQVVRTVGAQQTWRYFVVAWNLPFIASHTIPFHIACTPNEHAVDKGGIQVVDLSE